jgi:uncharacterized protein YcbK (DUF882 family)
VKAAVVAALAALAGLAAGTAHADAYVSKKDQYLLARRANQAKKPAPIKRPAVGKPPAKIVNLYNTWTHEWLAIDAAKPAVPRAVVDAFLRCHFTNEPTDMADKLIPTVVAAARHFNVTTVDIVSGFRHPKYNLMLRKKGRQVARDSQHTHGTAIDFWLPGVPIATLHAWAKARKMGGVGLYLGSGFIHMDTGPIRYWNGE